MRIAINWFWRIWRMALRSYIENYNWELEIVAINDLTDNKTLAHLFKYDSTYWIFNWDVNYWDDHITINWSRIHALAIKSPAELPWKELWIDLVFECTWIFTSKEKAQMHITAWAKRVMISAPAKDEVDWTFVYWVNDDVFDPNKHFIFSNASCTTNCLAPVVKVLHSEFTIVHGLMNTIHSYTWDQNILDCPHKDLRRARTAWASIIPTTTWAAKAIWLIIPELKGKLDWFALRVPTQTVSCVDLSFITEKEITKDQINNAIKSASEWPLKWVLWYEVNPLVSVDYKWDRRSSIVDSALTQSMWAKFGKVVAWYDNEFAYATRMIDMAIKISKHG